VVRVGGSRHLEDDVGQGRSLGDLPVDTGGTCSGSRGRRVDDKVADLTVKVVLVRVPVAATAAVRVGIDHGHTGKVGESRDDGKVDCISNQLSHVVGNDGAGHSVCTLGEIHESGADRGRITSLTASSVSSDGRVDGGSVIGDTVSLCTKVFDVPVHLVGGGVLVEGSESVVGDVLNPKVGGSRGSNGRAQALSLAVGGASVQVGVVRLSVAGGFVAGATGGDGVGVDYNGAGAGGGGGSGGSHSGGLRCGSNGGSLRGGSSSCRCSRCGSNGGGLRLR